MFQFLMYIDIYSNFLLFNMLFFYSKSFLKIVSVIFQVVEIPSSSTIEDSVTEPLEFLTVKSIKEEVRINDLPSYSL